MVSSAAAQACARLPHFDGAGEIRGLFVYG